MSEQQDQGYLEWVDTLHGLDRGNQIREVADR